MDDGKPKQAEHDDEKLELLERTGYRNRIDLSDTPTFGGIDVWNCYDTTWVMPNRCPEVGVLQLQYSSNSERIVESKSLKLFLADFWRTPFRSGADFAAQIAKSVGEQVGDTQCEASLTPLSDAQSLGVAQPAEATCLDVEAPEVSSYDRNPELLRTEDTETEERVYSNLLRSLCPHTGQPDYGTVLVHYQGPKIVPSALVQYVASLRNLHGFHEHCCELIFSDLIRQCHPVKLAVGCFYNRRGGLDINPIRWTLGAETWIKYERMIRQ